MIGRFFLVFFLAFVIISVGAEIIAEFRLTPGYAHTLGVFSGTVICLISQIVEKFK